MSLDSGSKYPSKQHREWVAAQAYILEKDGGIEEMRMDAELANKPFKEPNFEEAGVKEAYDHITEILKNSNNMKNDLTCNNLFEDLIHEKSFNFTRFTNQTKIKDSVLSSERAKYSPEGLKQAEEKENQKELTEQEIRKNIDALMAKYSLSEADKENDEK